MRDKSSSDRGRAVAELAARQHGVVSAGQLSALGLTRASISRWAGAGRLHRLHHGVYAVGHPVVSVYGHRLAAVLACGVGALASHITAAAIWGLRAGAGRVVHVTLDAGRGRGTRAGIRVHRRADLVDDDRARMHGIPVTSLARTLVDLGDVVPPTHVRAAFVAAERRQLIDMTAIDATLERVSGRRRGARVLTELLRAYDPRWSQTRSGLELAMLDLLAAHGLPPAEVNAWVGGRYLADLLWADRRLVVEVDSDRYHLTPSARRSDRRRDHDLRRLGYSVVRIGEHELTDEPQTVAARLGKTLDAPTSARPS